ncbi:MAG: 1-deoxy-D-xylulose-5-phosphate reductoisomerase [Candidatus Handelsmanbacteria bacterium RIFCSPLOWO2_12_FULL_64_10]|uniref:1-deoxy-D-xylulose 5-phosphate reductoisomerase n=1 Tax=Handelsmanbacteria sp. (strain RIFCSPLOWO2_12_FULL_64_10) TaxID=1817868 RepID=A0A1F6C578_HANXR|nr:MAG: 1-deoxy-D-xylulose-5-phosphate reductoisomerase [Candidatus Handelsmanbacteria bacterium RIFCSPLOWO2_12_FULL_64_10]
MVASRVKRVAVLGSTGSIGTQTLDLVSRLPDAFKIVGLGAGHWSLTLAQQVELWRPELVALSASEPDSGDTKVLKGPTALEEMVDQLCADIVVLGTPGLVGLPACIAAVRQGAVVLLANKETLVSAGAAVSDVARTWGGTIIPVDSEHSGIWQCLRGERHETIQHLYLTSSGGALRDVPLADLPSASPEQALRHPNWKMGAKITIDSATLMNKGLEIIEASWLFGIPASRVSVVLHRQSIVHAIAEFRDGSMKAQMSLPDMRHAILYGLGYPDRLAAGLPRMDLFSMSALTFEPVDEERYPAVSLARQAAGAGGTYPAVLNAANEVAVELFLAGTIRFTDVVSLVKEVVGRHESGLESDIESVLAADRWARQEARTAAFRQSYSGLAAANELSPAPGTGA